MKLTLGSGPHYAESWVNFDLYAEHADVRGDLFALPFPDATFTHVYAGHVLEHLPYDRLTEALTEARRVLVSDGRFVAVGPCIELAVQTAQPHWLLDAIIRHGVGDGSGHVWTPTAPLTLAAVRAVFPTAELVPVATITRPEWPNPSTAGWQCAVAA